MKIQNNRETHKGPGVFDKLKLTSDKSPLSIPIVLKIAMNAYGIRTIIKIA